MVPDAQNPGFECKEAKAGVNVLFQPGFQEKPGLTNWRV
jgi:hypothetical protein